jgi:hypothetical protein
VLVSDYGGDAIRSAILPHKDRQHVKLDATLAAKRALDEQWARIKFTKVRVMLYFCSALSPVFALTFHGTTHVCPGDYYSVQTLYKQARICLRVCVCLCALFLSQVIDIVLPYLPLRRIEMTDILKLQVPLLEKQMIAGRVLSGLYVTKDLAWYLVSLVNWTSYTYGSGACAAVLCV